MSVAEAERPNPDGRKPDKYDHPPEFYGSFDNWKAFVNGYVTRRTGLSSDDLPDVDYFGLYVTGNTPREAGEYAIDNAKNY